jgi:hypothetical protein
MNVILLLS